MPTAAESANTLNEDPQAVTTQQEKLRPKFQDYLRDFCRQHPRLRIDRILDRSHVEPELAYGWEQIEKDSVQAKKLRQYIAQIVQTIPPAGTSSKCLVRIFVATPDQGVKSLPQPHSVAVVATFDNTDGIFRRHIIPPLDKLPTFDDMNINSGLVVVCQSLPPLINSIKDMRMNGMGAGADIFGERNTDKQLSGDQSPDQDDWHTKPAPPPFQHPHPFVPRQEGDAEEGGSRQEDHAVRHALEAAAIGSALAEAQKGHIDPPSESEAANEITELQDERAHLYGETVAEGEALREEEVEQQAEVAEGEEAKKLEGDPEAGEEVEAELEGPEAPERPAGTETAEFAEAAESEAQTSEIQEAGAELTEQQEEAVNEGIAEKKVEVGDDIDTQNDNVGESIEAAQEEVGDGIEAKNEDVGEAIDAAQEGVGEGAAERTEELETDVEPQEQAEAATGEEGRAELEAAGEGDPSEGAGEVERTAGLEPGAEGPEAEVTPEARPEGAGETLGRDAEYAEPEEAVERTERDATSTGASGSSRAGEEAMREAAQENTQPQSDSAQESAEQLDRIREQFGDGEKNNRQEEGGGRGRTESATHGAEGLHDAAYVPGGEHAAAAASHGAAMHASAGTVDPSATHAAGGSGIHAADAAHPMTQAGHRAEMHQSGSSAFHESGVVHHAADMTQARFHQGAGVGGHPSGVNAHTVSTGAFGSPHTGAPAHPAVFQHPTAPSPAASGPDMAHHIAEALQHPGSSEAGGGAGGMASRFQAPGTVTGVHQVFDAQGNIQPGFVPSHGQAVPPPLEQGPQMPTFDNSVGVPNGAVAAGVVAATGAAQVAAGTQAAIRNKMSKLLKGQAAPYIAAGLLAGQKGRRKTGMKATTSLSTPAAAPLTKKLRKKAEPEKKIISKASKKANAAPPPVPPLKDDLTPSP
jgi:hypothetical protein